MSKRSVLSSVSFRIDDLSHHSLPKDVVLLAQQHSGFHKQPSVEQS